MSFFSDINGFNMKAIKNVYDQQKKDQEDFSEVDFCVNGDDADLYNKNAAKINNDDTFESSIYEFNHEEFSNTDSITFEE